MSLQLDTYLAERAAGLDVLIAADRAGIGETEALLTEKAIESGQIELPRARAREETQSTKEAKVARDSETTTTMSINGGPEMPLNLDDIDDPANAEARAAITDSVARATGGSVATDELRLFIERIERLAEERKGIADDISDVYGEAKARGYDKPTMRRIVKLRAMDEHAREEAAALLETYANALGLQGALPL